MELPTFSCYHLGITDHPKEEGGWEGGGEGGEGL